MRLFLLAIVCIKPIPANAMQDSDTNPNTTASSVAGDIVPADGRRKRSEAFLLRKSVLGKKHGRLDESKVWLLTQITVHRLPTVAYIHIKNRKRIPSAGFAIFSD